MTEKTAQKKTVSKKKEALAPSEINAPIFDAEGKQKGTVTLPEALFGLPWNANLVHDVVVTMQANRRSGTAHAKDRSEVSGGGKKPWKQKGTGNARHGSNRSPLWRSGGVTFGPRNDKQYGGKINRKMRRKALAVVLSQKLRDNEIVFVDSLSMKEPKTKEAVAFLGALSKGSAHEDMLTKSRNSVLVALGERRVPVEKSFGNMGNATVSEVRNLNALSLMTYKYLVIENPEDSLTALARPSKDEQQLESTTSNE